MNIRTVNALLLMVALVALTYANSFSGQFFFDDEVLFSSERFTRWPSLSELFQHSRSLVNLSFTANVRWGGQDPWGFHLINLLIHLVSTVTIWSIASWAVTRTLEHDQASVEESATSIQLHILPWIIAVTWAVHPLTTESVTYVIQRYESMAVMWMLLCLRCWCALMDGKLLALAGVGIFAWCAVLSKEMTVSLPFLLFVWDYFFRMGPIGGNDLSYLSRRYRLLGYGLVMSAWTFQVLRVGGYLQTQIDVVEQTSSLPTISIGRITPWDYLKTQSTVIFHYLKLTVWPFNQRLDYGWPLARNPWIYVPCLSMLAATAITGLILWLRRRPIGLLVVMFFIALAPRSSIIPSPDMVFEHRMHLPLLLVVAAIQIFLGYLLCRNHVLLSRKVQHACYFTATLLLLCFFCSLTHLRNQDYQSELLFWQKNQQLEPDNPRVNHALGNAYADSGNWITARIYFVRAIKLQPEFENYWIALGDAEREIGDINRALDCFSMAIKISPLNGPVLQRRGYLFELNDQLDLAETDYLAAAKLHNPEASFNLALLYTKQGRVTEAIELCQTLLQRGELAEKSSRLLQQLQETRKSITD